MSNATMAMGGEDAVTPVELGWKFVHWGLGLFILGFVTGFVPILHYMAGAQSGGVGPEFLKNVTLWWGCPAVLVEMTLKTGSLGMVLVGLCYVVAAREGMASSVSSNDRRALLLCSYGLIAMLAAAAVGFVVCNIIWRNFYFDAVPAGKNTWLGAQGLCVVVYFIGLYQAVAGVRRVARERR